MSWGLKLRGAARRFIGVSLATVALVGSIGVSSEAAPIPTVGVLVPIVADAGDGQLLSVDLLESATAQDGQWAILTELAASRGLTIALDTRILASIGALGNDVPASVADWRDAVLAEDPLLLPWGNADVWAYPSWSTNPFSAEQFAAMSGVDPRDLVIWPSGWVVPADAISVTQRRGFGQMLVYDDQFSGGINRTASTILWAAVKPGSTIDIPRAVSDIRNLVPNGGAIALPADPSTIDVTRAVTLVEGLLSTGRRSVSVRPIAVSSTQYPRAIVPGPEELDTLMAQYQVDEKRAALLSDDVESLLSTRLRALTAVTASLGSAEFDASVSAFVNDSRWLSDLVSISLATEYTVLSNTAEVPVNVSNESAAPVTVTVVVRSTSGIVQVDESRHSLTIEPQSNARIMVPMTAVANGRADLVAQLVDADSVAIGKPVTFPVEVQAQWEFVTVVVFFGSVSIIMTIGIFRTIRRRRVAA